MPVLSDESALLDATGEAVIVTDLDGRIVFWSRAAERLYSCVRPHPTPLIADDGMGIDPDLLPRVFDPFVQSARPIERAEGGLGIGLAIVKSVVELHGVSVAAASEGRDRGTSITVTLPVRAISDDSADDLERPSRVLRAQKGGTSASRSNGLEALRTVESFQPEVPVLDVGLPVMDGYELAQRLRSVLADGVRFIAVTGYGQANDRARSKAAGFDLHLVKPIDLPELQRAIHS